MGWLVLIFGAIAIAKIAEADGRSGGLWGTIAVISCFVAIALMPELPMINMIIGLGVCFMIMFALNVVGPTQQAAITR